jgi:hypothetical protein
MLKELYNRFWRNKNFNKERTNRLDDPNPHLNDFGYLCAFPNSEFWMEQHLRGNLTLMGAFCVIDAMGKLLRKVLEIDKAGIKHNLEDSEREKIKLILIEHLKSMRQVEEIYLRIKQNHQERTYKFRIIINDEC